MKKTGLLLLVVSLLAVTEVFSQKAQASTETNCSNGTDDDSDGFVDCFDIDCSTNSACAGGFLNNNIACQAKPTGFPTFSMQLKWTSVDKTTNHLNRASVGDLDGDKIPEVVVTEVQNDIIYILNGKDGSIKASKKVSYGLNRDPLIGKINSTGCAWIFTSSTGGTIYAYDGCTLTQQWSTKGAADPILLSLADFDGDGNAELYYRDEILDAKTGKILVAGTNSSKAAGGPIAVDILDSSGNPTTNTTAATDHALELVSGCNIFTVDLVAGKLTLAKNVANFVYWTANGNTTLTSVVDYNQDGALDVISTGMTVMLDKKGNQINNATAFFWDVKNNAVLTYNDADPTPTTVFACPAAGTSAYYKYGWHNGIGRINIADIDGDGKLNATFISGKYLYALKEDWTPLWNSIPTTVYKVQVNEETSGYTGCTVYDFNGDGAAEIVYRDEKKLYIFNGDGSQNTTQQCVARTNFEYPIVADIDGDGTTELCVTCGFNDTFALNNFCALDSSVHSAVRVFQSAGVAWVPSRRLWNQHGYFNVNVNDDLTIPKVQQRQTGVFSTGVCTKGSNTPLNSFLNQSPYLDSKGCPTYAAPNLVNVKSSFKVVAPTCPNTDFTVTVGVKNKGDVPVNTYVPITFYSGDPTKAGAVKLNTDSVLVKLIGGADSATVQTFPGIKVTGTGGTFTLYISLNDNGKSPIPVKLPNAGTKVLECDYSNIISAGITPKSAHVTAVKVNDNVKCIGATVPDNGAATANVGGNTVDYTFYWYNGAVSGAPSFTGASYTGLAAGTYKVFAVHKTASCNSDTASVTINQVPKAPMTVAIIVDQPNTNCTSPNGQLHADVNNGDPVINYNFQWFEGNNIFTSPQIGTGYIAPNLKGGQTYTVLATDKLSGCQVVGSLAVPDGTPKPVATASAVDAICVPLNSGSASANVGGLTAGYTFSWYKGTVTKPSADFVGSTYSSIPAGSYTVVATDNVSSCNTPAVTVTVNPPPPFVVSPSKVTNQTSCDPAAPNGSVTANVGGVTAGYTFKWFKGQSTAAVDAIPGPTGLVAGKYTVLATNNATGCTASDTTSVKSNLIYPVITLTPTDNSICNPALAASTYNGSVVAAISYNGAADPVTTNYNFVWHNGPLSTDPTIGANANSINQLNGGSYTLVATRKGTSCAATKTAPVGNIPPTLIITPATPIKSTNCDLTLTPDGQAAVAQVNGVNVGSTTNFGYQWYNGSGTGTIMPGRTSATLSNVQGAIGQNYTVEVTDKTNGCQNTLAIPVGTAAVNPALSLSKVDNGICHTSLTAPPAQYGGSVTTTITNLGTLGITDYTVVAFGGGSPFSSPVQSTNSPNQIVYSQLKGDSVNDYTIVVKQISTGCISAQGKIQVKNITTLPAISSSAHRSFNCTGGAANGSIDITKVDGAPTTSPYVFQWFNGIGIGSPIGGQTNPSLLNIQGSPAGTKYTVQVTNHSTGCQNTKTISLGDSSALPVLGPLSKTDNTFCVGSNGTATTGTLTFSRVASINTADFTFAWSNGSTSATSITGLAAGTYTLTATHTATNCVSNPVSATIKDSPVTTVVSSPATGSTNCSGGSPNGFAIANVTSPAGTYEYRWYQGTVVGAPNAFINTSLSTPDIRGKQGGSGAAFNYIVEVTVVATGCKGTSTTTIPDNSKLPIITPLGFTDNTFCSGSNGTAFVDATTPFTYRGTTITSPYTGFTLSWSGGTVGPVDKITALAPGSYTLQVTAGANTVTNNNDNCISNLATVTITDHHVNPVIATTPTPQTACVGSNGKFAATGDGFVAGYTFVWKDAGGTTLAQTSPGSGVIDNLASANYNVKVTNNTTGCSAVKTDFLPDNVVNPSLTLTATGTVKSCSSPDGSAQATITNLAVASGSVDYSLYYDFTSTASGLPYATDPATIKSKGDGNNVLNSSSNPPPVYGGMVPGYLSAVVVDNITKCESVAVVSPIIPDTSPNQITITGTPAAGFCGGAGGGVTISVTGGVTPRTFAWYASTPTNTNPINFYNQPPDYNPPTFAGAPISATQNLVNVGSGAYTVVVTDAMGCGAFASTNVPFAGSPTITPTTADVTKCATSFSTLDGSIKVDVTGASVAGYVVEIFKGNSPVLANRINSIGPAMSPVTLTSTLLASGDYYIQVTDQLAANIACPLGNHIKLDQKALPPIVSIDQIDGNTSCDPTTSGDGKVIFTVTKDAGDATTPDYYIKKIDQPTHPAYSLPLHVGPSGTQVTLGGMELLTYKILVRDTLSHCKTDAIITIPNQPVVPGNLNITLKPETFCVGTNGSATIAVQGEPVTEIDFTWAQNPDLTLPVYSATGGAGAGELLNDAHASFWPLGAGGLGAGDRTYYVQGVKNSTAPKGVGCPSPITQVVIPDQHIAPTMTLSSLPNTSCDPLVGEGSISIIAVTNSSDPAVNSATYDYVFDVGGANTTHVTRPASAPLEFISIKDGSYLIRATNNVSGCKGEDNTTVAPTKPLMNVTNFSSFDQKLCAPNPSGAINVKEITIDATIVSQGTLKYDSAIVPKLSNNFDFLWFSGTPGTFTSGSPLTDAFATTISSPTLTAGGAAGQFPTMAAGTYYVVARRKSGAGVDIPVIGRGCETPPFEVKIKDASVNPAVSLAPFNNTACDVNYEGKITVSVSETGPGSGKMYTYVWDPANPTAITLPSPNNNNDGDGSAADSDGDAPTKLQEGIYKIKVTNNFTNCFSNAQTNILPSGTPIVVANATPQDQKICGPDGQIKIGAKDIVVDGTPDPIHANFDFVWQRDISGVLTTVGPTATDLLDIIGYASIGAGDYYVTAARKTNVPVGSGCKSAPFKVTIRDVSVNPSVTLTPFTNTSCDNITPEGQIQVDASDAIGTPGGAGGHFYNYLWAGTNPTAIGLVSGSGVANLTTANLLNGTYDVQVSNNLTGCITSAQTKVLQSNTPVLAVIASKADQVLCSPDGSVTVGNVIVTDANNISTTVAHPNILFNWYLSDPTTPSILSGVGKDLLDKTTIAVGSMGKGTYYVTATRKVGAPGSGCTSPPVRVDVNDIHVDPTIAAATVNVNVNCLGAPTGTGQIQINETTPANFTYNWFAGDDITAPPVAVAAPGNVAQNLLEGDYTVQVKDNATSCVSIARYTISNYPTILSFSPSGFSAPAVNTCVLATGAPSNGSATITLVDENKNGSVSSVPVPDPNYTFTWYDATNTQLQNGLNPVLNNVPPGSYMVTATNTASHCTTDFSFKIDDNTLGSTVTLISFGQPERCINPVQGFLTAQGGGSVPGLPGPYTFSYEWYAGDLRPAPAPTDPVLVAGSTLSNIPNNITSQIYTVKTINNNSNCWVVDAYTVPLIVNPVVITASTNPLTFCTSDNGEAFSTIANDNKFEYNFMWGKGNSVNPPVDFSTNDVTGLPAGNYTVVAVDKLDPGCVSPTVTVTIDNMQSFPVVSARVLKGLTICDPARPDGVASADVSGDFVHYTFDWYVGKSVTGSSFYRGAEVGGLTSTDYTVVATETITGCSTPATISVPTNFAVIPAPTVTTVSNLTSCVVDNGELSATVDGVTKDYIFDWRNGSNAPPPIDFTGDIYKDLAVGNYTVIATSRITGCVSSPTTAPITNDQKFPEFEFLIQDATCTKADGNITIMITDNVNVAEVTWYQGGAFVANGPNLTNANAGMYQITVRTDLGCETTENVTLPANINPFNGVSKLADGKNDMFMIDCIEQFPQNHVEIFNRAGTKVYEADGYNNMDVLFDGKSNRGISIMGTNLPAGTYYYVISKGDGSKHVVGYLELVD